VAVPEPFIIARIGTMLLKPFLSRRWFLLAAVGLILPYATFFLDWLKHCPQDNCASYIEDRDDIPGEPPD